MREDLVFTNEPEKNWLYQKYYYAGGNSRYWTFQLALNLLSQQVDKAVIIETGCQRMDGDLGAGMSTSIFGEYVVRYGGRLITVDLIPQHLEICKQCTMPYSSAIDYVLADSVDFLSKYEGQVDLLYLDSLDYPVGDNAGDIA